MIRSGEYSDRFAVVQMAKNFQSVAGFPLAGDAAYFSMAIADVLSRDDATLLVVDIKGPRGFLIADIGRSMLSPEKIATEHLLWIEPEARGGWFRPLVLAYLDWAKAKGCVAAYLSAQMDDRTGKIFERFGFEAVQTHHLKVF